MSDFTSQINQILSNEDSLNQIKALANSLGLNNANNNENNNNNNNNTPNINNILNSLGGNFSGNNANNNIQNNKNQSGFNIDPQMLIKMQSILSNFNGNDKNTNLLYALKEHLGEERQKKIDDAIKIMKLIKILPTIKEMGLFGGDLFWHNGINRIIIQGKMY